MNGMILLLDKWKDKVSEYVYNIKFSKEGGTDDFEIAPVGSYSLKKKSCF